MRNIVKNPIVEDSETPDALWGAAAIGRVINRSPSQVYYLHSIGALKGAVSKVGHKTLLGSRRLRELPFRPHE
jgi:hypothetical protein